MSSLTELLDTSVEESTTLILKGLIGSIQNLTVTEDDLLASVLDVRTKDLEQTEACLEEFNFTKKELLTNYLKKEGIYSQASQEESQENSTVNGNNSATNNQKETLKVGMRRKHTGLYKKTKSGDRKKTPNTIENEIDLFLSVSGENVSSILSWWNENKDDFKNISHLAKAFIPVPIISLPDEMYEENNLITKCNKILSIDRLIRTTFCFLHFNKDHIKQL